jgi:hypothetical protein
MNVNEEKFFDFFIISMRDWESFESYHYIPMNFTNFRLFPFQCNFSRTYYTQKTTRRTILQDEKNRTSLRQFQLYLDLKTRNKLVSYRLTLSFNKTKEKKTIVKIFWDSFFIWAVITTNKRGNFTSESVNPFEKVRKKR